MTREGNRWEARQQVWTEKGTVRGAGQIERRETQMNREGGLADDRVIISIVSWMIIEMDIRGCYMIVK